MNVSNYNNLDFDGSKYDEIKIKNPSKLMKTHGDLALII